MHHVPWAECPSNVVHSRLLCLDRCCITCCLCYQRNNWLSTTWTSPLCRTTDMSVVILPLVLELSRLFGTFYVSPANMPV